MLLRLAHLTDTHINGTSDRQQRLATALGRAQAAGAHHLLLTGDLTANGRQREFQELGQILEHWPHSATIARGNHDGAGFEEAITGPLSRFFHSSVNVQDFGVGKVVPVSTYYPSRGLGFRAMGRVGVAQTDFIENVVWQSVCPVVLAMHHGPQRDPLRILTGLVDGFRIQGLLDRYPNVHICCGHDHRLIDLGNIHVAASVAHHPDPLRLYDVADGLFRSVYKSRCQGKYFGDADCPIV